MIEMVLAASDVGRVRFAHSPVRELVASVRTLHDPARRQVYANWHGAIRGRLGGLDLDLLRALSPVGPHAWNFLAPPITRQWENLTDELDAIAATPPAAIRAELEEYSRDNRIDESLRPLYENPGRHLTAIVEALHRYWQVAITPVWPKIRALAATDLVARLEQFAANGLTAVFNQLHGELAFRTGRLFIDKAHHCVQRYDLSGQGVLLVPCVFTWPILMVACCGAEQPMVAYPARGSATIGETSAAGEETVPLEGAIGRTRAAILTSLDEPRTTTGLATYLDVTASAISQHMSILKAAGLVRARRRGRYLPYERTPTADALLAAAEYRSR